MQLKDYLNSLPRGATTDFAKRCAITPVYLSQITARQDGRLASPALCVVIERATDKKVTRQELRPDDYWLIWPDLKAPRVRRAQPAEQGA